MLHAVSPCRSPPFSRPHFSPFVSLRLSPRKSSPQSHSYVSTPSFSSFIVLCSSIDTRTDAHGFVDATDIVITTTRIVNDYYYRTLCWVAYTAKLNYCTVWKYREITILLINSVTLRVRILFLRIFIIQCVSYARFSILKYSTDFWIIVNKLINSVQLWVLWHSRRQPNLCTMGLTFNTSLREASFCPS